VLWSSLDVQRQCAVLLAVVGFQGKCACHLLMAWQVVLHRRLHVYVQYRSSSVPYKVALLQYTCWCRHQAWLQCLKGTRRWFDNFLGIAVYLLKLWQQGCIRNMGAHSVCFRPCTNVAWHQLLHGCPTYTYACALLGQRSRVCQPAGASLLFGTQMHAMDRYCLDTGHEPASSVARWVLA
jgi:hypothetical protein